MKINKYDLNWEITLLDYETNKVKTIWDRLCTDDKEKIDKQIKKCERLKQDFYLMELIINKEF
jgi:hypothetical protein